MEHKSLRQLQVSADVRTGIPPSPLSREERIERWAKAIEDADVQHLKALFGTEYVTPDRLSGVRRDGSPLSVAFADPVLRAEGLRDDTYGAARDFFGLSDTELHRVVCYCYYGERMPSSAVTWQLRSLLPRPTLIEMAGRVIRHWFAGR
jgi:hypothetical protein